MKFIKIDSDLNDSQLFEDLDLLESLLYEGVFSNPSNLNKHYEKHVMSDSEEFDPMDPKFLPILSKEEYRAEAEIFSNAKASKATYRKFENEDGSVKRIPDTRASVVGFELNSPTDKGNSKYIKIFRNLNLRYIPKEAKDGSYILAVMYTNDGDEILSFYIMKKNKYLKIFNNYFKDELPENKD